MLALYGHPFSSYTWKALILFYAHGLPFDFRMLDPDHPVHGEMVSRAGPGGKFPVLDDDGVLAVRSQHDHRASGRPLLAPSRPDSRRPGRGGAHAVLDRVFDNYVMAPMQAVVSEHLRPPQARDPARIAQAHESLRRSYAWLERWLTEHPPGEPLTLVEMRRRPFAVLCRLGGADRCRLPAPGGLARPSARSPGSGALR